jgi:hypothetical protein
VSKTNQFTIIATALLGILLYTIIRFGESLPAAPMAGSVRENETSAAPATAGSDSPQIVTGSPQTSTQPLLTTYADLVDYLNAGGRDGARMLKDTALWRQDRGFFAPDELLGITPASSPRAYYDSLDEATLKTMSDSGDAGATQTLASITALSDPFAAMTLFSKAAEQGSAYALLRLASLSESFSDLNTDGRKLGPDYLDQLLEYRGANSATSLKTSSYAHVVSAMRDGGLPVIDTELLAWQDRLEQELTDSEIASACDQSERMLFDVNVARRKQGKLRPSVSPPPVFVSPPDAGSRLPCTNAVPDNPALLDQGPCEIIPILTTNGQPANLNICESP